VFHIRIQIQSGQWIRNPDPGGQKLLKNFAKLDQTNFPTVNVIQFLVIFKTLSPDRYADEHAGSRSEQFLSTLLQNFF
jgi:hypothetical protein